MLKPLTLALPLMLHQDQTIENFKAAKQRIEQLGEQHGVQIDIGAFPIFMPPQSYTPENLKKQVENQQKHRLPIVLVETAITAQNSLAYVPADPTFDPSTQSNLETIIEQVARLRDLSENQREGLVVGPHVGIKVVDIPEGDFSKKCFYSARDFVERRKQLYGSIRVRFGELRALATSLGLTLAPENAYPAIVADSTRWKTGLVIDSEDKFTLHYEPFNDLASLREISGGNIVFDVAHLACTLNAENSFRANGVNPKTLFDLFEVSSWSEFRNKIGSEKDYLSAARAIHISGVEGIGVRVPSGTETAKRWGGGGTLPNLISPRSYVTILRHAQEQGIPVSIEQEYALNPQTYLEADEFLKPILEEWSIN